MIKVNITPESVSIHMSSKWAFKKANVNGIIQPTTTHPQIWESDPQQHTFPTWERWYRLGGDVVWTGCEMGEIPTPWPQGKAHPLPWASLRVVDREQNRIGFPSPLSETWHHSLSEGSLWTGLPPWYEVCQQWRYWNKVELACCDCQSNRVSLHVVDEHTNESTNGSTSTLKASYRVKRKGLVSEGTKGSLCVSGVDMMSDHTTPPLQHISFFWESQNGDTMTTWILQVTWIEANQEK